MSQRRRLQPRQRRAHQRRAAKAVTASMDWVREQAWRQVGDGWVREVFTDRLIVERENGSMMERPWSVAGDELVLGDPTDVTLEYVAKAEGGPRLAGPIVAKDEAKRLVYGAVLVPGEPDSDGEELSTEKIEDVAHTYLESFRAIDVQHDVERIDASPVESYIEPADREVEIGDEAVTLPAGTWTMAVRVHDDDAWARVTKGEATGFSIMGVPESDFERALEAIKSGSAVAFKRTTLADVGGGDPNGPWVAPFVSLVDQPAVPKAKFYAIKRAAGQAVDTITEEADMTPQQVQASVKSALGEALKPVTDRLDKLEKPSEPSAEKDGTGDGTEKDGGATDGAAEGANGEATVDAIKSAVTAAVTEAVKPIAERVDRVEKRTRPGSRQPGADDDYEPTYKGLPGRDAFGRRITE